MLISLAPEAVASKFDADVLRKNLTGPKTVLQRVFNTKGYLGAHESRITGSYVVMETKVALQSYPAYHKVSCMKILKTKFPAVGLTTRLHRSEFAISSGLYSQFCLVHISQPPLVHNSKKLAWTVRSSTSGGFDPPPANSTNGGTRLIRAVRSLLIKLNMRIQEIQKDLPMKLIFFLVGFYCATAFATVIGQTGDWDILSAALAVAVVEGIGALMYGASFRLFNELRRLLTMFNYWKAGLSLGLFLDSFKYEIGDNFGLFDSFNFELDLISMFL